MLWGRERGVEVGASKEEARDCVRAEVAMAAEGAVERRERVRAWAMLAAGTAVACVEAWLVGERMRVPPRRMWAGAFFWSVVCAAVSVSGGAVAAQLAEMVVPGRQGVRARHIWWNAGVAWAFLPSLVVLALRGSWWALVVAAVATAVATLRLRPVFRGGVNEEGREAWVGGGAMRSLEGLPPMDAPPMRSLLLAASAQVCVLFVVRGAMLRASVALAACVAMLIAWWVRWDGRWVRGVSGDSRAVEMCGTAVLLLMLLLTPWIGGGGMATAAAGSRDGTGLPHLRAPETGQRGVDYVGVILWPPQKKKPDIEPPRPKAPVMGQSVGARPMIIPFDGPYWYFKAPMVGPGPKAHVTVGDPKKASVKSTDWMPLRMEAHQNLGMPIDLSCCKEIDVTVTNGDDRPGRIDVGLVLTNTDTAARRQVVLGDEPVMSSVQRRGTLDRAPVTETLKFAIPARAGMQQFNEINVILQPSAERSRLGSRIAIEQFELVPR